jgi:NAD(P)-dependent dehydrogenase (short-subunit alcohol dehydrogenase family)
MGARGVSEFAGRTNLRGVFVSCQAVGRHMPAAGCGSIVAIASMSGNRIINVPMRIAHYHAAKGGVDGGYVLR